MVDSNAVVLWGIAAVLGILVARRGHAELLFAVRAAGEQLALVLPRICLALLLAGFIGRLLPGEMIGHMIGYDSGWNGILLACLLGGMMPSGPMIAFPIVVVLRHNGAGVPQIVAFVTAWSVFAWHRVLTYEIAMLGWQFTAVRVMSSLVLPLIGASIAVLLCLATGMR
jgi:uncharacterized membrane protein YraQ (UPF0718 family)